MQNENYSKSTQAKQAAMELRRVSIIRPMPHQDSHKASERSFEPSTFRSKTLEMLNGLPYNITITIITLYVLFADDLRQVFFPPSADLGFTIVVIICMTIYCVEIVLNIIVRNDYFLSFFFWLDLISTGTMVFDLMWINVGGSAGVATNIVQIARAGKASRIGARSARMIRIVKLIRMVQDYKTAKQEITSQQGKQLDGIMEGIQRKVSEPHERNDKKRIASVQAGSAEKMALDNIQNPNAQDIRRGQDRRSTKEVKLQTYSQIVDLKETRVGIKLKEEMETNSTLMIMLVLISVPLLASSTWFQEVTIYENSISQLEFFMNNATDPYTIRKELEFFVAQSVNLPFPLVYMDFPINSTLNNFPRDYPSLRQGVPTLSSLRASSTMVYEIGNISVAYDTTAYDILTSQLNIGRTLFVCILLVLSSLLFSQDVEEYLLEPLESMLVTVKRISADPLKAIIALQNEKLIKSTIKSDDKKDKEDFMTEPTILENMIVKIGSLLVVGFGEAGSQIIVKNIEAHGAINPVLSGTKMIAIFGFCDIRNFTDATQVLQTGVMNFVNDVAQIVHGTVNKFGGSANKNIGDAFLLVWKFKHKEVFLSENNGRTEVTLRKIKKVSQIADLAVFSFMNIIAQLAKAPKLQKYANNRALCDRIKDFTGVKMGFGLHVGWAIEGAIGSQFKIDASYLSPNVNMASRLQAATKQFGVFILCSGQVVQLMTPGNKKLMRLIDRVTVKGSIEPIDLYTLDICIHSFLGHKNQPKADNHVLTGLQKKKMRMFAHKTREIILNNIESGKNVTDRLFSNDKDFQKMREQYSDQFFSEWAKGYELYIRGEWAEARTVFQNTLRVNDFVVDGPSNTILEFLESHNNQAPHNWQGFRQLTEK